MIRETKEFLAFANGTRKDFHEPDEQGIGFVGVEGTRLDNAGVPGEVTLIFSRDGKVFRFNLATICALAQRGAHQLVGHYLA